MAASGTFSVVYNGTNGLIQKVSLDYATSFSPWLNPRNIVYLYQLKKVIGYLWSEPDRGVDLSQHCS